MDSCFGELNGLAGVEAALKSRFETAPEGSYIKGLFDSHNLLRSKIMEETNTLCSAGIAEGVYALKPGRPSMGLGLEEQHR